MLVPLGDPPFGLVPDRVWIHPDQEIIFVLEGTFEVTLDASRTHHLEAGDAMTSPAPVLIAGAIQAMRLRYWYGSTRHRPSSVMMEVIDLHTHVIPEAVLEWLANGDGPEAVRVAVGPAGTRTISHANGLQYEVFPTFTDPVAKLEQMDEVGIDTSVVSLAPELFGYEVPRDRTVA